MSAVFIGSCHRDEMAAVGVFRIIVCEHPPPPLSPDIFCPLSPIFFHRTYLLRILLPLLLILFLSPLSSLDTSKNVDIRSQIWCGYSLRFASPPLVDSLILAYSNEKSFFRLNSTLIQQPYTAYINSTLMQHAGLRCANWV